MQKWCAYSILERTKLIEKKFHAKISQNVLLLFYKANKVKYRSLKMVYRQAFTNPAKIEKARRVFAVELTAHIMSGRRIFYMDESTACNWNGKARSWGYKDMHNVFPANKERFSVTMFGAIGTGLAQPDAFKCMRGGTTKVK